MILSNPNSLTCREFLKNLKPTHIHLLTCLPAVRPTSGRRIGPVFLTIQNINMLTQICCSFILHCFSFSLTGEQKARNHRRGINGLYGVTYYVLLMVKCKCTWLDHPLKLLSRMFLPCTDSSQPGWFHVVAYNYVCSWAMICQYSCC